MSLPSLRSLLVFALLSFAALGARAQTPGTFVSTISAPANGITSFPSLSKLDCTATPQDSLVVSWSLPLQSGQTENIWLSKTESCATVPTPTEVNDGSVLFLRQAVNRSNFVTAGSTTGAEQFPQINNSDETLSARRLFDFLGPDCPTVDTSVFFCVRIETPSNGVTIPSVMSSALKIALDSTPPATPINVTAEAMENGLIVNWDMPQNLLGATHYDVTATAPDGTVAGQTTVDNSGTRSAKVNNLANGTTYALTVVARDASGTRTERNNASAPSAAGSGTPVEATDFFEAYKAGGGKETGGCQTGGASLLALLPLALLLRRRRLAACALAAVVGAATSAQAQTDGLATVGTPRAEARFLESPRHYTFELHFGEYRPNIDTESGLTGEPYKKVFNNQQHLLWRIGAAVDVFSRFGRLQLGAEAGFWQAVGHALGSGGATQTRDTVLLTLVPLTPMLTYRADFLWERWGVPLVPYGKLGYGFVWWQTETHGKTSTVGTAEGEGWARGLEAAVGLQLVLDALEQDKAAQLDQDFGINSTSLYVEYAGHEWEGAHGLQLHGSTFSGGLLFAF